MLITTFLAISLVSADSEASLKAKLDQKVTLQMEPGSLQDALDALSKQFHITFQIDKRAFEKAGFNDARWDTVVLEKVENVPLGKAVHQLLYKMGASYRTMDGKVVVVPRFEPIIKPSPDEQARLVIEWAKPEVKRTHGETSIVLSGKAYLRSSDGRSRRPVDWVQPIDIALARSYKNPPDWSKGLNREDTVWYDQEFINWKRWDFDWEKGDFKPPRSDGSFGEEFPVHEIHRAVGATKRFRVGIVLGGRVDEGPVWTPEAPVLPQSVADVEIPGPAPISRTLQIINGTAGPLDLTYDPAAAIRAVNHLRALGQEKAIQALRDFGRLAESTERNGPVDSANIDTSTRACVELLVPLVFQKVDLAAPRQLPDLVLWQDIPFLTYLGDRPKRRLFDPHSFVGPPYSLVDWAANHGKIINKPLRPPNDPCAAVDALVAKLQHNPEPWREELLRMEAWRMLSRIPALADQSRAESLPQPQWDRLKADVRRFKVRWDEDRQEYVAN
jgi:hypothetical protein